MKFKVVKLMLSVLFSMSLISLMSCGDDSPGPGGSSFPKKVAIEYRMSATSGGVTKVTSAGYTNETGGNTSLSDVALPFSVKLSRTVDRTDALTLAVLHNNSATNTPFGIKLEILIDGKVEKTQTFEGTTAINNAIVHMFYP